MPEVSSGIMPTNHIGDRQMAVMWEEICTLHARIRELLAENAELRKIVVEVERGYREG